MSDNYDPEYDEEDNSPGGLRKALEKAKKSAKDALARAEKAETERDTALKTVKSKSLVDILRDQKVPTGLSRWLEKDDVEATPEAVAAWLKENGEFFNVKPAAEPSAEAEQEPDDQTPDDEIDPELVAALTASQQLDASGVSPSNAGTMQRLAALNTDPSKGTYEDLVAQLAGLGADID